MKQLFTVYKAFTILVLALGVGAILTSVVGLLVMPIDVSVSLVLLIKKFMFYGLIATIIAWPLHLLFEQLELKRNFY